MDKVRFSEEKIRRLLGNKKAFDQLDPALWSELFFVQILENKYLGRFGRKKIRVLARGLQAIEEGRLAVPTCSTSYGPSRGMKRSPPPCTVM